jgi:hypothetical protein
VCHHGPRNVQVEAAEAWVSHRSKRCAPSASEAYVSHPSRQNERVRAAASARLIIEEREGRSGEQRRGEDVVVGEARQDRLIGTGVDLDFTLRLDSSGLADMCRNDV